MIRTKSITKPGKPGFYIRYIRPSCCEYSGMTQSGIIKKGKKGKKMINEFENYIQALKNLYTCMISLQDSLDEYERYDLLYDVLTDYLMVVERTARFLSRVKMVLKNMRIEEDIK